MSKNYLARGYFLKPVTFLFIQKPALKRTLTECKNYI